MITTVVVPVDGSTTAEQALEPAARLALRLHATLEVVQVFDPAVKNPIVTGAPPIDMRLERDLRANAQKYIVGLAERARNGGGLRVETKLLEGKVTDTLIEYLRSLYNPLVVMTTHGRTGIRRAILGSVTDALVRSLTVPVLTIRAKGDEEVRVAPDFKRVLVPIADGEFGKEITETALDIFGTDHIEYVLFNAVVPMPLIPGPGEPLVIPPPVDTHRQADAAHNLLDILGAPMRARGANVRTHVVVDDSPSEAILNVVKEENPDVVCMATHGYRGLTRIVLGSVAQNVLHHSPVPVLLVRPHETDTAMDEAAREPSHARVESPEQ